MSIDFSDLKKKYPFLFTSSGVPKLPTRRDVDRMIEVDSSSHGTKESN